MQELEIFLSLIATVLGFLITTITFLVKNIKSTKTRQVLNDFLVVSNSLMTLIQQAEGFINFSGEEKKQYVIIKALALAKNMKTQIDEKEISEVIEELIALSKKVNYKDF